MQPGTHSRPDVARPRVFVTYAWETPAHVTAVAELCEFLSGKGVDVRSDRQCPHVRRNWENWTTVEMLHADYVLVIASPSYRAVSEDRLPSDERRGVRSEYQRLVDLQHQDRDAWTRKILPVVLPGRSPEEIPLSFLPFTADHYPVTSITDEGAACLLRVLLHRPAAASARARRTGWHRLLSICRRAAEVGYSGRSKLLMGSQGRAEEAGSWLAAKRHTLQGLARREGSGYVTWRYAPYCRVGYPPGPGT